MDRAWWQVCGAEAQLKFKGERFSAKYHSPYSQQVIFEHGGNSGAGAMSLAEHFGARKIIMLGYDCGYGEEGERHWHGDHPRALGNAVSMPKWDKQFAEVVGHLSHCNVINASRKTALTYWPTKPLEEALC